VTFFPHTLALLPDQHEQLTARGIKIAAGTVTRLVIEEGRLRGVELDSGSVPRAAVFVRPRLVPSSGLRTGLGCAVGENGWVVVVDGEPLTNSADLSSMEPFVEVAGVSDGWWCGADTVIAVYRGEAWLLGRPEEQIATVYSGITEPEIYWTSDRSSARTDDVAP
jgi:hypothetical protein